MRGSNSGFKITGLFLAALAFGGCESYELYDGPEPSVRIAVSGIFSPRSDFPWEVRLARVRSIQEPQSAAGPIDDAEVTVTGGGETLVLRPRGDGLYAEPTGLVRPVAGVRYRLLVRHPTLGEASAEDAAPAAPAVELVGEPTRIGTYDTAFGRIAQVRVRVRVTGTGSPYLSLSLGQFQPPFTGQVPFEPALRGLVFSSPEPSLRGGYDDDAPIRNGDDFQSSAVFIGAFGPVESREVDLLVTVSVDRVAGRTFTIEALAFSEAQYQHARSRALQIYYADDPLAEPVPIVSNVTGGYGIFGGYNASPDLAVRIPD